MKEVFESKIVFVFDFSPVQLFSLLTKDRVWRKVRLWAEGVSRLDKFGHDFCVKARKGGNERARWQGRF